MSNASNQFIVHACVERASRSCVYLDAKSVCVWTLQSLEDPDKKEVHFSRLTSETKSLAQALRSVGKGLTYKKPPPTYVQFILMPCHDEDVGKGKPTDIILRLEEVKKRPFISYSFPVETDVDGVLRAAPMNDWIKRVKQDGLVQKRKFVRADIPFISDLKKAVDELMESNDAADLNIRQGNVVMMDEDHFNASKLFWEPFQSRYLVHVCVGEIKDKVRDLDPGEDLGFLISGQDEKGKVPFSLLTSDERSFSQALVAETTSGCTDSNSDHKVVYFTVMPCEPRDDIRSDPNNILLTVDDINKRPFVFFSFPINKDDQGVLRAAPMIDEIGENQVPKDKWKPEWAMEGEGEWCSRAKEWFPPVFKKAVDQLTAGKWDEEKEDADGREDPSPLEVSKLFWEPVRTRYLLHVRVAKFLSGERDMCEELQGRIRIRQNSDDKARFSVLTSDWRSLSRPFSDVPTGLKDIDSDGPLLHLTLMPCKYEPLVDDPTNIRLSVKDMNKMPFLSFSLRINKVKPPVEEAKENKQVVGQAALKWTSKSNGEGIFDTKATRRSAENFLRRVLKEAVREQRECETVEQFNKKKRNDVAVDEPKFKVSKKFWEKWEEEK